MGRVKDSMIGQLEARGAWHDSAFDLRHRAWNLALDIQQDVRAAGGWPWAAGTRREGAAMLREQAALLTAVAAEIEAGRDAGLLLIEYAEWTKNAA